MIYLPDKEIFDFTIFYHIDLKSDCESLSMISNYSVSFSEMFL